VGVGLRALAVVLALAAVCLAGSGVSRPGTAHAANVGELIVLEGRAVVTRAGKPFIVRDRAPLQAGDRVDTLAGAKAHLAIGGQEPGVESILSSRTSVTVHALQPGVASAPISLAFGALRARVRAWSGPPLVATPAAVVGIKGTDFVTWVKRPKAAEFVGVEGLIECVSQSNKSFSIRIGPRQWGEIVENQKPKAPVAVPDALWNTVQKEFAFPGK